MKLPMIYKMKSILAIFVLLLAVTTISAQTHNVTRGSKPSTTKPSTNTSKPRTTTPTKKGNAASSTKRSGGNRQQGTTGSSASSSIQSTTFSSLSAEKRRVIDNLINNMVSVSGGTFTMGATSEQGSDAGYNEIPTHQVTLSSFSIGKYEVTQEEWQAVMGSNPSKFKGVKRPVENVTWNDCQEFVQKLNAMTGRQYRLPTEAEWEYAARGGNNSRGYKYAGSNSIGSVAWYDGNSNNQTHPVGQKFPNELGLYDMSGNVDEWCSDWYGYYSSSSQTNPKGATSGSWRVYRGGSWGPFVKDKRVSNRTFDSPGGSSPGRGCRLVLSSIEEQDTSQIRKEKSVTSQTQKPVSISLSAEKRLVIDNLVNNMVFVNGGTFSMGGGSEPDDKPIHQVNLSSFYIGRYEVTQEEWEAVMDNNPSFFKGLKLPVENVSWNDCQEFIRILNKLTGHLFRLPTEAEWEYAARGGNRHQNFKYSGSNDISSVAWYSDNSNRQTHLIGQKIPNELGLYDMSGNVWEMCSDLYGSYRPSLQSNPKGASSGSYRICRGGSFGNDTSRCSVVYRYHNPPTYCSRNLGFRLVGLPQ